MINLGKKRLSLERDLLREIKEGKGSVMDILSLTNKYDRSISEVSQTLQKLVDGNQVIKSGDKYIIISKGKKG